MICVVIACISTAISIRLAIEASDIFSQIPPANKILEVVSGSMCVAYGEFCPGRLDPSEPTLHIGDLIIIQTVDTEDLNADYPDSDIIAFSRPGGALDDLITHRIAAKEVVDDEIFFYTKGDGNPVHKWPDLISENEYDSWGRVPAERILGKVVCVNFPLFPLWITFWVFVSCSATTGIAPILLINSLRTRKLTLWGYSSTFLKD
jgi:signal peptidase I